jgi:hypothetical protein
MPEISFERYNPGKGNLLSSVNYALKDTARFSSGLFPVYRRFTPGNYPAMGQFPHFPDEKRG